MGASSYLARLFKRRHKDSCTSDTSLQPHFPNRNEAFACELLKNSVENYSGLRDPSF